MPRNHRLIPNRSRSGVATYAPKEFATPQNAQVAQRSVRCRVWQDSKAGRQRLHAVHRVPKVCKRGRQAVRRNRVFIRAAQSVSFYVFGTWHMRNIQGDAEDRSEQRNVL